LRGIVFDQKTTVKLAPAEADVLKVLMNNWPEVVTRHTMLLGLHGKDYEEKVGKGKALKVHLSKLRRKIKCLDLTVKNSPGRGWWLAAN
jgi:DNA-binding response OmpR family regulator